MGEGGSSWGEEGSLQAAQLRRPEQLRGPACAPAPHLTRGKPSALSHPSPWVGCCTAQGGGGQGCAPIPLPRSRMFTHQGALGTRGRSAGLEGPGGPRSPAQGPWGRGRAGVCGWGWGPGLCPLSLSLSLSLCRATGRNPTPSESQAAGAGQAPTPGFFSKSRPDLPVVRAVTEVVQWGRGLPAC